MESHRRWDLNDGLPAKPNRRAHGIACERDAVVERKPGQRLVLAMLEERHANAAFGTTRVHEQFIAAARARVEMTPARGQFHLRRVLDVEDCLVRRGEAGESV